MALAGIGDILVVGASKLLQVERGHWAHDGETIYVPGTMVSFIRIISFNPHKAPCVRYMLQKGKLNVGISSYLPSSWRIGIHTPAHGVWDHTLNHLCNPASLATQNESSVRVPLIHSYLCPVLGPKYNRVAESEFPTSARQVEMWVFRDVYREEERDLVKDGLWTGKMSVWSSQRHVSPDTHFPVYKKSHASWQWSCLLLHMPLSSINVTLPNALVNTYIPHILIHLTPQILTTHLEHIAFHYLHSTISSCNLDLHFYLKAADTEAWYLLIIPYAQNSGWNW